MSPTAPDFDAAFKVAEERAALYEATWWMRDRSVEEVLVARPGLEDELLRRAWLRGIVETEDVFRLASNPGEWLPARVVTQEGVLDTLFPQGSSEASSAPLAVFLLGVPGSGKTSVLKPAARRLISAVDDRAATVRDADEIRELLPEYEGGRGSRVVQSEVVDLTYGRAPTRIRSDSHLIVDLVGDPRWLVDEVTRFGAEAGREVVLLCAEVDIETAVARAKMRAVQGGRIVSLDYVRSCQGRPYAALRAVLDADVAIARWALVDTEQTPPSVIASDGSFSDADFAAVQE